MMIIGCDYHPRYQQIAMMDTATGELVERRLEHENGEARAFYASLAKPARVGMEATGYAQWFERMLDEQGTSCGSVTPARFVPAWCGSRRRTRATQRTCCGC